jgi:hypothetical protein
MNALCFASAAPPCPPSIFLEKKEEQDWCEDYWKIALHLAKPFALTRSNKWASPFLCQDPITF